MSRSVMLIGGPDTGKTNYVGRLWRALNSKNGALRAASVPKDVSFAERVLAHLLAGRFAPRTNPNEGRNDFTISVTSDDTSVTDIVMPDITGELWSKAVLLSEIDAEWMNELRRADGAVLFLRVHSDLNEQPLDWVTSRTLLSLLGKQKLSGVPTQVMVCELIRFLEGTLSKRPDGSPPRLAVVVSAWDRVDADTAEEGPESYLHANFPMLAGRLEDISQLDVRVYGLSVVGGDLGIDSDYRDTFLDRSFDESGWVAAKDPMSGSWRKTVDVTLPIAWVVGP